MAETLNLLTTRRASPSVDKRLQYPENIFSDYTDYVKFDFYKYQGPFSGDGGGGTNSVKIDGKTGLSTDIEQYNQSIGQQYKPYGDVAPTIFMYMPEDISSGFQTDWTGKGFTNVGANALRVAGGAMSADGGRTLTAFMDSIKDAGGAVPTAVAQGVATAINAVAGGQIETNDVLQGSLGVVLNPNTELMFQGFSLRSFGLKFKMSARNEKETKAIRQIAGVFKKVSLPTYAQEAGGITDISKGLKNLASFAGLPEGERTNNNYIGVPGLVQVSFMRGNELHPFLPQYKTCAISSVEINYTPDGTYSTLSYDQDPSLNGAPVAVELSLGFSETKLIYSDEIVTDGVSY